MKVILTQDIEKLGSTHEIVEVAEGYARNYLEPRGLAITANKSALANLDNLKRIEGRRQNRLRSAAQLEADKIIGKTLILEANTGREGKLYGSITNADIAEAIGKNFGVEIDRRQITLTDSIRMAGIHNVPVLLHKDVKFELTVQVGDLSQLPAPAEEVAA